MLKGGKTVEQLKALEALFTNNEHMERKHTQHHGGRRASKRYRKNKELEVAYREATMRPVDLYRLKTKGVEKINTPDWRKTGEVSGVEKRGNKRIIHISVPKPNITHI